MIEDQSLYGSVDEISIYSSEIPDGIADLIQNYSSDLGFAAHKTISRDPNSYFIDGIGSLQNVTIWTYLEEGLHSHAIPVEGELSLHQILETKLNLKSEIYIELTKEERDDSYSTAQQLTPFIAMFKERSVDFALVGFFGDADGQERYALIGTHIRGAISINSNFHYEEYKKLLK